MNPQPSIPLLLAANRAHGPTIVNDNATVVLGDIYYYLDKEDLEYEELAVRYDDVRCKLNDRMTELDVVEICTDKCLLDCGKAQNRKLIQDLLALV